ncbi:MAG: hypothetical protein II183_02030 [Elusimicrobiaceae bacterium]|nr:hypothetical protein [Elusimicrobiaceae bacterium]
MELLVTVIIVAVLASYAVYHYTNIMDEGKLNAAKGKLAGLGGATARFLLENANGVATQCNYSIDVDSCSGGLCSLEELMNDPANHHCVGETVDQQRYMLDVIQCGYAEKSLGYDNYYSFYIGCPGTHNCGTENTITAFMKVKSEHSGNANFPACVYFDPNTDKVVEVN